MAVLLRPQCTCHTLGNFHDLTTLIVDAQYGWHTVPAGRSFQCRGKLLIIANASSRSSGSCRECGSYNAIPAGGHPTVHAQGRCHIAGQVSVVAVKALVPLVDVIGIYICDLAVRERKTRLDLQRPFQLLWQRFAPFKRPAQYPQTSPRRQIILCRRCALQNPR